MCQEILSNICWWTHVDVLVIEENYAQRALCYYQNTYDFKTLMYDHTLHQGRKYFCLYCLQDFSTKEIVKFHINDRFKVNGKQIIWMPK